MRDPAAGASDGGMNAGMAEAALLSIGVFDLSLAFIGITLKIESQ